ncbi:MAG TPA: carbohydrate kinase family protein [Chthoniobacterales bacterium]|jgi:sugar/nucleoside kinase (ribokinase family)
MRERLGLLAGGNWIVDKLKVIDTYPQQDALANILGQTIGNGGSPFNVLLDLAKLGASFPLAAIGLVGADGDGKWIYDQCVQAGINTQQLRRHSEAPTSYTDVMTVQSTGRRTFFHQRGANAFLAAPDFEFQGVEAKIFHLGYLLLLDQLDQSDPEYGTVAARVLHAAQQAGCKTSIDVVSEDSQRFSEIVVPALKYTDYCILNEFEIERTTGIATRPNGKISLAAVEAASRVLLKYGGREWVIVHFPEGATALGADQILRVQGSLQVPQERIVGTVGAGDAFAAGVLFGLHEELTIETALRYGVSSAASCLFGAGTSNGVLPIADCLALGTEFGTRQIR